MKKTGITIVGGLILLAGIIMLVTPGPGLLTMAVGLAILGREYHWARRLLARVRAKLPRSKEEPRS
jgi:uncharacterized protein (TIGR02611 family)